MFLFSDIIGLTKPKNLACMSYFLLSEKYKVRRKIVKPNKVCNNLI